MGGQPSLSKKSLQATPEDSSVTEPESDPPDWLDPSAPPTLAALAKPGSSYLVRWEERLLSVLNLSVSILKKPLPTNKPFRAASVDSSGSDTEPEPDSPEDEEVRYYNLSWKKSDGAVSQVFEA